jgi:nucleotide-binding universal stress UspA family protein
MSVFNKILVAVDEQHSGQAARRFAANLSDALDVSVQVFHPERPHGATRRLRDRELANAIAAEAQRSEVDLIVLGLKRRILGRRHMSGSVRQQLSHLTRLPIMAAPTTVIRHPQAHGAKQGRGERRPLVERMEHV